MHPMHRMHRMHPIQSALSIEQTPLNCLIISPQEQQSFYQELLIKYQTLKVQSIKCKQGRIYNFPKVIAYVKSFLEIGQQNQRVASQRMDVVRLFRPGRRFDELIHEKKYRDTVEGAIRELMLGRKPEVPPGIAVINAECVAEIGGSGEEGLRRLKMRTNISSAIKESFKSQSPKLEQIIIQFFTHEDSELDNIMKEIDDIFRNTELSFSSLVEGFMNLEQKLIHIIQTKLYPMEIEKNAPNQPGSMVDIKDLQIGTRHEMILSTVGHGIDSGCILIKTATLQSISIVLMSFFKNHKIVEGDYTFDQIEMLDAIGTGNSSVYSARVRGKPMAVKQIIIKNEDEARLVHRQITLMKQLSELNEDIIRYEGCLFTVREVNSFNKMKLAYIVMEQGITSLESVIQRKIKLKQVFRSDEIEAILTVLLRVFLFLEKRNIAHCDIKPENIIIMSIQPLKLKVCDIGSCRVITGQATQWSTLVGTVPFLAPQLIRNYMSTGCANNPFKSDVFSLGLCLLYLTTFKKFKSNQRLKIDQPIYKQVISEWIKQAKQRRCNDMYVWELLDSTLEFDETKRVQFKKLLEIFQSCVTLKEQERRQQVKYAEKKTEDATQEVKLLEKFNSCQETFSKDRSKERDYVKDRSLTRTNGFRSTRTKNIKQDQSKYITKDSKQGASKQDSSRYRLPRIPIQTIMAPFTKKQSSASNHFTQIQSPARSKKSSSIDVSNNLIVINKSILANSEQTIFSSGQKFVILNCWYWGFEFIKALSINMNCEFKLAVMVSHINKLFYLNTLVLNIDGYQGEAVRDADMPENLTQIQNLTLSAKNIIFQNYKPLFKFFLTKQLKKLTLLLTSSTISPEDFTWLTLAICQTECTKLVLFCENIMLDDKTNRSMMDILSKSKLTKLSLYLGQNRIQYTKEFPWQLPKGLTTLELDYSDNKIGVAFNSLSLNLQQMKAELRHLILDLRHCSISTKQLYCLFSCISKISLQTVILKLSQNQFDDSAIKFISKSLTNMTNLVTFEFQFHKTSVTSEGWLMLLQAAEKLFKSRANHIKVSFDRFDKKEKLFLEVKRIIVRSEMVKDDYLFVDNDYFSVFLRRRPLPQPKVPKTKTFCTRLFTNCPTQNHYLCLTCKSQREMMKFKYFCEFCSATCVHKGHNLVKLFIPAVCSCAFSGECKSDVNDLPCSKIYHELFQRRFQCLKCDVRECCLGCVGICRKAHAEFVRDAKNQGDFQCRHPQALI